MTVPGSPIKPTKTEPGITDAEFEERLIRRAQFEEVLKSVGAPRKPRRESNMIDTPFGPTDPVLLSIAEALWCVKEGYGVADRAAHEGVEWHPGNAEDSYQRAMLMGHAEQVLEHLIAAGWMPPEVSS